jgi:5-(carboxyamino)imidazole ribonucleotide mutase
MKKKPHAGPPVAILMGSASDWPSIREAADVLREFGVAHEVRVLSAHRSPEEACSFAREANRRGLRVLIAAAGGAAHLAGVLAAHTPLPVIGIPVPGGALNGLDALLSTVQMPGGIPVATVAIGKAGAMNAALLAVQILGTADPALREQMIRYKQGLREKVAAADRKLRDEIAAAR